MSRFFVLILQINLLQLDEEHKIFNKLIGYVRF